MGDQDDRAPVGGREEHGARNSGSALATEVRAPGSGLEGRRVRDADPGAVGRDPEHAGRLAAPPVLTMVAAYSRFVMAVMLPTRTSGGLPAGMWALLGASLGAVPKMLVWDNEAGIGQHHRLTVGARGFAGTLGTRIYQIRVP